MNFWKDSVFVTCIISWFIAQLIKVITVLIKDKRIDFRRFVGSGGMPSSHSSFVTALAASVAITDGFESTSFAISAILALVVMYDAAGVRRAAGQQAKILNKIVEEWEHADFGKTDKRLKELLGHTPFEVFAGAILGIFISLLRHLWF